MWSERWCAILASVGTTSERKSKDKLDGGELPRVLHSKNKAITDHTPSLYYMLGIVLRKDYGMRFSLPSQEMFQFYE